VFQYITISNLHLVNDQETKWLSELSLFNLGPYPQDDDGTHNGCADLTQTAVPLYSDPIKHIATDKAANKTQQQIYEATLPIMPHDLAGYQTGYDSYDNCPNHKSKSFFCF
jgi:hypothetical protein